ncbi:hypothetical protein PR202_ga22729 [Eleusine coracana subsp. coracana]|uniref:Protein kinase domain-containing protein n=1 Tax=Eleusine coracana subsp. coracana TaxID=191504 RepID=A0AAV5D3B6_ELECO|nr:hypothetical protein PR202_ga22729 [Eleusine coracana subsp. coracana]
MASEELLRKIRELEEGQAELKREVAKLVPEHRRPQSPSSSSRRPQPSPARRALAALPQSSSLRMQRMGRIGLTDRQHIRALHALGQSVYVIAPGGELLYWSIGTEKVKVLCCCLHILLTWATKVTSSVRSRIKTGQNSNEHHGSVCESKNSEHGTSGTSTSSEDVVQGGLVTGENSSGTSKSSSDDTGEGKEGLHKILSSKAETLLAKKGISWPWRGLEHYGPGKSPVVSSQFQDAQENDLTHQGVPEPIIVPDYQDTECDQIGIVLFSNRHLLFVLFVSLAGSCGTVYHAQWYGSDVAVKVFSKQEYSEEMINMFRQEVSLMKKLRHPNTILFMGAVASHERLCIVTEFLPRYEVCDMGQT